MNLEFTKSEVEALNGCIEAVQLLIDYHDAMICEAEAMDCPFTYHTRRIGELKAYKKHLEDSL